MAVKLHDEDIYPMMKSLNADPRLIGLEALICPFVQNTSSQRLNMLSSNIVQALIVDGAEMPVISSGYEREFLNYTFNPTRMPQSGTSLYVIPKYRANAGSNPIKATPSYTIIYIGQDDGMIHSLEVPTYMRGIDGFGYFMEINTRALLPNVGLQEGQCIAHSHAVQGSKYALGANANVCYITRKETVEDAFCISESFAKRMESTAIKTLIVDIGRNEIPLNLYGDVDNYKILPDIGEYVREDGLILALRSANDNSIIADMNEVALTTPQYQHDNTFYASAPNAQIIDIDVWINENRKVRTPEYVFTQFNKYVEGNKQYYKRILEIYKKECIEKRIEPAAEFGSLVERAAALTTVYTKNAPVLGMTKKTPPKFSRKNEVIPFIQLVVTYAYKNVVAEGYKFVGREGGKGVVSRVLPDNEMPRNDYGVVADLCMAPEAVVNRMNLGQLYEQFLNCCCSKIVRNIRESGDYEHGFDYILEFITDVNPDYAEIITKVVDTPKKKHEFVAEAVDNDILVIVVPPFLSTLTPEWCLMMTEKYGIDATPVEYDLKDSDGNFIRRVRTVKPIYIGKKYLYVLCKIPYARACSVSYVNQYKIPIRIKERKVKEGYPVGLTPIRLGEDEVRNLVMMVGETITSRILALYANSAEGTNALVETLLTAEHPTQIEEIYTSNSELHAGNQTIKVYNHLMHTVGVDSINTTADESEIAALSKIEESFQW